MKASDKQKFIDLATELGYECNVADSGAQGQAVQVVGSKVIQIDSVSLTVYKRVETALPSLE